MTFRRKLMLTMAPLVLALLAVGLASGVVASRLAQQPVHMWHDNYRSVRAVAWLEESVERLHEAALLDVLAPGEQRGRPPMDYRERFEHELAGAMRNITEPGETEALARLQSAWLAYRAALARVASEPEPARRRQLCFGELDHAFLGVKHAAGEILAINQDAMARRAQQTQARATFFQRALGVTVLVAFVLAVFASLGLAARLLRPLGEVSGAVRRFGQGDTEARARVAGDDDIAHLAQEFNTMADSLERYRRSSLGELLQAQQAAQAAIDGLPDPVLMLDAAGDLQSINEATRRVLGIDPAERGDLSLAAVEPKLRVLLDGLRARILAGQGAYAPRGFEDAAPIPAGDELRVYLPRATPIRGENGRVSGSALVLQDITQPFRYDQLKDNLVATVAHEVRTPLTSLRMAIHLCIEQAVGPLTPKQTELLVAAGEDCARLQAIVDELLDLSRLEAGRMLLHKRPVSAASLVEAALDAHRASAHARQLTVRGEAAAALPELSADPDRLHLVFGNLLTNAIRCSPTGGEIVVRALVPGGEGADAARAGVRFEVSDAGPGIPAGQHARLFQKFARIAGSPAGGAGLGLFIARGIVEAHDGRIGIASTSGPGATFWFEIPAA